MRSFKKPILIISVFILLVFLFIQPVLGIRVFFPAWLAGELLDLFQRNPKVLTAAPYKDGTILLLKPIATGVGEGRYEAGDIVEIRDGTELYAKFGQDLPFLGESERTRLLPVYYPGKLTQEQKKMLLESEETQRREYGLDYTQVLSDRQILKVRNYQKLDKLPEVDLSNIIQKTTDQASAVKVPRYLSEVEKARNQIKRIARNIFPTTLAQSESIKTVDTGGWADYSSLNAWEGGEEGDLTSGGGTIAVAKLRHATATSTADTTAVTIGTGWDTSATNYIKIWTDPDEGYRHNGVWDEGKYRLSYGTENYTYVILISESNVKIDGLQIEHTHATANERRGISVPIGYDNIDISNSIIRLTSANPGSPEDGIAIDSQLSVNIWNNIIYDWYRGIYYEIGSNSEANVYNNTIIDCNNKGISAWNSGSNSYFRAKNNLIQGASTNYDFGFDAGATTEYVDNLAEDPSSPNNEHDNKIVFFVASSTDDFRLAYGDTNAKDNGTDLSSDSNLSFGDDVTGQTRTGSWDIGADEYQAVEVYRSVGPSNNSSLASGTGNNLTISGGIATFASPLPQNAGVGDAIQYDSDDSGSVDAIVFIHKRHSPTSFTVRDYQGFITASSTRVADQNWDVYRAYAALEDATNGDENTGLNDTVQYFEDWAGDKDLASSTQRWNIAAYADAADTTVATIEGWTTTADNYLKIYTPVSQSEVGTSQRHEGKWDSGRYIIKTSSSDSVIINTHADYLYIEGLQIEYAGGAAAYQGCINSESSGIVRIYNNICRNTGNASGNPQSGFDFWDGGDYYIWNNIIYDWNSGAGSNCLWFNSIGGNGYIYNNTLVNCTDGIHRNEGTAYVKNNIVQDVVDGYNGTFNSASDYNISDIAGDQPDSGANDKTGVNVNFQDAANDDFHLAVSDDAARNSGTDLSADSNLAFKDDIDGEERPGGGGGWDIGADELKSSTLLNAPMTQKLTDGLVGYWTFNGPDINWSTNIATDKSGQGNHGEITNMNTTTAPVIGKVGQALDFDGNNDQVDVGDIGDVENATEFSITAWIYPHSTNGWQYVVTKYSGTGTNRAFKLRLQSPGIMNWEVHEDHGIGQQVAEIDGGTSIATSSWYFIVGTFKALDSTGFRLYVNGIEDSNSPVSTEDITESQGNSIPVVIGDTNDNGGVLDGIIDEVRVYNRALSADEIGELYRAGAKTFQVSTPITEKYTGGLIGHWTFNGPDMNQTTAFDRSGQGNHGTINGARPAIGKVGQGIEFDGNDDNITVPDDPVLGGMQELTITAWVKLDQLPSQTTNEAVIFEKRDDDGTPTWTSFTLKIDTQDEVKFQIDADSSADLEGATAIEANTWYHVVGTYDGSDLHVYLDGQQDDDWSESETGPIDDTDSYGYFNNFYDLDGLIDEVRIYDRALSADEIGELYRTGERKFRAN